MRAALAVHILAGSLAILFGYGRPLRGEGRDGGNYGAPRLARHLWRMCWALWIATGSFFFGQADEFPEALRIPALLAVPALMPLVAVLYWLIRVRVCPSLRKFRTHRLARAHS